eukprot:6419067-Prymnesium_polylepis.1
MSSPRCAAPIVPDTCHRPPASVWSDLLPCQSLYNIHGLKYVSELWVRTIVPHTLLTSHSVLAHAPFRSAARVGCAGDRGTATDPLERAQSDP